MKRIALIGIGILSAASFRPAFAQDALSTSHRRDSLRCSCPYTNWNNIYSFNDTISKIWGQHNFKAGLYFERTEKVEQNQATGAGEYLGSYSFASSSAMPNKTQDGYANAFLGNFNNYQEGGRIVGDYWFKDIEAFVQDSWRVSRRLTLDLGIRFYHQVPTENYDFNTTDFVGSTYTWNKIMSNSPSSTSASPYFPTKFHNYGPSYAPTPQVLVANYVYEVPNLGQRLNIKPLF